MRDRLYTSIYGIYYIHNAILFVVYIINLLHFTQRCVYNIGVYLMFSLQGRGKAPSQDPPPYVGLERGNW